MSPRPRTTVQVPLASTTLPPTLRLLRITDGPQQTKETPEAAIVFDADPKGSPRVNDHFEVRECHFTERYKHKQGAILLLPEAQPKNEQEA